MDKTEPVFIVLEGAEASLPLLTIEQVRAELAKEKNSLPDEEAA